MKAERQDLFRPLRDEWLVDARTAATELLKSQESVTIEDVLLKCPRPSALHRNVTGHVFKTSEFKWVRYTRSKRAISNGRVISVWRAQSLHSQLGLEL